MKDGLILLAMLAASACVVVLTVIGAMTVTQWAIERMS